MSDHLGMQIESDSSMEPGRSDIRLQIEPDSVRPPASRDAVTSDDLPPEIFEDRPRPWTKLVAVLHLMEPVVLDNALVYTQKDVAMRRGRVRTTGLIRGLAGHDACVAQAHVLRRLLTLQADEEGAKKRLPLAIPVAVYSYLIVTLGLAIAVAAANVNDAPLGSQK